MQKNHNKYSAKTFPFLDEIKRRFFKFTGIEDVDVEDALIDVTGDSYHEMRKLISKSLCIIENFVAEGKYKGYSNGRELTEEERKNIKSQEEDLKTALKAVIEESWRETLNKQKVGIEKLGLSLKKYLK